MPAAVIVGLQWGDEGKGKITDFIAGEADANVRFQGGANAGHTVDVGNQQFKFHQVPSGMLHRGVYGIIADGSVVDPPELLGEIEGLKKRGFSVSKLFISDRAHIVMPYHKQLDGAEETLRGTAAIGTTRKGIGPCYADKHSRIGFRMGDLLDVSGLREKIDFVARIKNAYASAIGVDVRIDADELYSEMVSYSEALRSHIADTPSLINGMMARRKRLLFEGAHGIMLDIDHGNYPFVTSSNTVSGDVYSSAGLSPRYGIKTIGILKAYSTRVGSGPFPTELSDSVGEHLALKGMEVGTTTGRRRRCGWLDLFAARYAVMLSGVNEIVLTKLDVLSGIDRLKVAVGYTVNGKRLSQYPSSLKDLMSAQPVYREFRGWDDQIDEGIVMYRQLPAEARRYVEFIEKFLRVRVRIVSVGHSRDSTILRGSASFF
ncbi:MAG: adenylosuccinate synthase [Thermoplasmata archaeon]|uniref:Adenylosuccinate synthetase n=1 Tax=Candidatus Sysuiplasma superficiale TaxID=2823368 RepID=A0A8J8CGH8_9ARCH|nr:adenylosuccinate synthase [Candidatus Sysuiplasma superficiale]MCL4347067.1 adenylosuccinate synthase [Candidatus Thermoplasmatota archaeon]MCL5437492.1 adenylosuccinate synthase [Candidatus Thermoplasmatota archaeon]